MKLRTSPSGPFFTGLSGDSLVCDGGDEWSVVSGVGTTTQSRIANIEFLTIVPSAVPAHIPGSTILAFGPTKAGEIIRARFSAALVSSLLTPVTVAFISFIQVSLDAGVTWKNPTAPGLGIGDTGAVASTRIAALDPLATNVVGEIMANLGAANAGPLVRLAYACNCDALINGAIPPGGFSLFEANIVRGGPATLNVLV